MEKPPISGSNQIIRSNCDAKMFAQFTSKSTIVTAVLMNGFSQQSGFVEIMGPDVEQRQPATFYFDKGDACFTTAIFRRWCSNTTMSKKDEKEKVYFAIVDCYGDIINGSINALMSGQSPLHNSDISRNELHTTIG